jgi:putative tricarboxylic transport membrane protein
LTRRKVFFIVTQNIRKPRESTEKDEYVKNETYRAAGVSLLKVPYRLLFPAIMVFSSIGIYSVNTSSIEMNLAALFGVLRFIWMKLGCPAAPMLLGFVLGPMLEENLRRALLISRGDPSVFITRPISLAFVIATILILLTMAVPAVRKRQRRIIG